MRNRFIKIILFAIISLSVLVSSSCGNTDITDTSQIILSVGSKDITLGNAYVFIFGERDNINNTYGNNIWDVDMGDSSFGEFFQDEVKGQIALCYAGAGLADKKGTKLTPDDEKLVKSAADYFSNNLSAEDKKLLGVTDEEIYNMYYSYRIAIQCYKDIVSTVDSEVSKDEARVINLMQISIPKIGLSEAEISAKKTKINEAYSKATSGEDFSTLIAKYNEGEETSLSVSRGELDEVAEKAAFNLNQDEISEVVETDNEFIIFKCTNPYNESLSISNRKQMIKDKKDSVYLVSLNNYLSNHPLVWNEELWSKINISNINYNTSISFFEVYNMFFPE